MANSVTSHVIPCKFGSDDDQVFEKIVVLDTASVDLTIHTPPADKFWGIVGIQYNEADPHNLSIKSGSTTLHTYQMAANQGLSIPLGLGISHTSRQAGEALNLFTSVAIATMLIYVVESKWFRLSPIRF